MKTQNNGCGKCYQVFKKMKLLSLPHRFFRSTLPSINDAFSSWWFAMFFLFGMGTMLAGLFLNDECSEPGFNIRDYTVFGGVAMTVAAVVAWTPYAFDKYNVRFCYPSLALHVARAMLRLFFLAWFVIGLPVLNDHQDCFTESRGLAFVGLWVVVVSALLGFCPLFA